MNDIFLIDDENNQIPLHKKEIKTLTEYNVPNYIFMYGEYFQIDYLIELFTDMTFYNTLKCDGKSASHIIMNNTKQKLIQNVSLKTIDSYIENNRDANFLMYGSYPKALKFGFMSMIPKNLHKAEIIKHFYTKQMMLNHLKLEKCFDMLDNEKEIDLVIYGKLSGKIKVSIESYMVKTLFVSQETLSKLKSHIDSDYFNFEIVMIEKLEEGDISERLMNDFKGVIGIARYRI